MIATSRLIEWVLIDDAIMNNQEADDVSRNAAAWRSSKNLEALCKRVDDGDEEAERFMACESNFEGIAS
jgi:hypothetical protein